MKGLICEIITFLTRDIPEISFLLWRIYFTEAKLPNVTAKEGSKELYVRLLKTYRISARLPSEIKAWSITHSGQFYNPI